MDIVEIRQKYPQYSDLTDDQLAKGFHSKFYSDIPYDQFAEKIGLNQEKPATAEEPSALQNFGRQLGLTGRAALSGVAAVPTMLAQGAAGLINTAAGTNLDPAGALQRTMTRVGLPEPQGAGERVAQDVAGAMTGQSAIMKAAGGLSSPIRAAFTTQPLAQVTGAAGSSGGAGMAREMGAGPVGQTIAGLSGGLTGTAVGLRGAQTPQGEILRAQNQIRDEILKKAKDAGYVVPPSTVNPTVTNTTIESIAGKALTQQKASVMNQRIDDTLAREALGLNPKAVLTEQSIAFLRNKAGRAYQNVKDAGMPIRLDTEFRTDVSALGKDFANAAKEFPDIVNDGAIQALQKSLLERPTTAAVPTRTGSYLESRKLLDALQNGGAIERESIGPAAAVELVKKLRFDASKNYRAMDDPARAALADAQRTAASAIDNLIERSLESQGKGDLSRAYRDARVFIAKAHDIESALQPDGHISGRVMNRIGQKGFLDGPLKTIADFAGAFPKAEQDIAQIGSQNVRGLRLLATAMGAGVGNTIAGPGGGAIGAVMPFAAPPAAQALLLSKPYQRVMANPNYNASTSRGTLETLAKNPTPVMMGLLEELQHRQQPQ